MKPEYDFSNAVTNPYVDRLKQDAPATPEGTPVQSLIPLTGTIPEADMAEMEAAIEEGCEGVDPDG